MQDKRVRGIYVSSAYDFVKNNYSPARIAEIEAQFSPDLKQALPTLKAKPLDWHPLHYATEPLRGIYESHDDPKVAIETIERCGRFIGDEATTTFMRLLLKMLTLPMLASKWQQFWGKYNNFGICTADASHRHENKFYVTATECYPYVHGIGTGWIQNVLKALNKQNVKVTTNVPLGEVERPEIIWTATWS
jgi:hypothetical protein